MKRLLALVVSAAAVLALAGAALSTSADVWKKLHRPLRIPHIAPGSPCPVSKPDPKGDLSRIGFVGTAWGKGPVYPGGLGRNRPVLRVEYQPPPESAWSGSDVVWMIDSTRRGPVLVRGRQLDGPNELRFGSAEPPPTEMRVPGGGWGSGGRASYTRLRVPGCYAWQIDGLHYTRLIVFEAVQAPGDKDPIVAALREQGLPMDPSGTDAFRLGPSETGAELFANPGGYVEIWEFPSAEEAQLVKISPGGSSLWWQVGDDRSVGVSILFIAPPHWFRSGRVLVLYVGSDPAMLDPLRAVLGTEVAGG